MLTLGCKVLMTAVALLAEIHRRGASIRVEGDRLRIRPRAAVRDLEPAIRARAMELAAVATEPAVPRDGRCNGCGRDLRHDIRGRDILGGRCAACCGASPVLIRDSERVEIPVPTSKTLSVVIESRSAVPAGPVRVDACTVVLNPARCIAADVRSLERIAGELSEAGLSRRDVERLRDDADEIRERLRVLGVRVRLETVQ